MTKNSKIVAYVDSLTQSARDILARRPEIRQLPFPQTDRKTEFLATLKANPAIAAVVLGGQTFGKSELEVAPGMQVVARVGVGYDLIDVPSLAPRKIPLMTTGIANSPSVAEEAFHLIFSLIKRGREHDRLVREGKWSASRQSHPPGDIYGKRMLCVGFGRIGTRVVKRALAMEMDVDVFDPFVSSEAIAAAGASPITRLDDAIPHADVLTLHCPRTPDTMNLIDARRLAMMKPSALLINTARGGIVDEMALLKVLREGRLAGAGLDVLEQEPPPVDHPLLKEPAVVFAPHMAGVTNEALERMSIASVENILSVFDGHPNMANVINKEIYASA